MQGPQGEPGSQATASTNKDEEQNILYLNLGIPEGLKGDKGDRGDTNLTNFEIVNGKLIAQDTEGQTIVMGNVSIVPKGEYSGQITYNYLDLVTYNGNSYLALKTSTNVLPTDTEYWQYITGGLSQDDIVDNLESTSATKMLSAKQGKILQEKKIHSFNTVAEMKADTALQNGMIATTLGYYAAKDGGAATYIIKTSSSSYYESLDNGLVAELFAGNGINVECFGAVGDGTTDDTTKIESAVLFCKTNNKVLSSSGKRYLISSNITIKNVQISFNWGCIVSNQKVITLEADEHMWDYNGDRIVIVEYMKFADTNVITTSPAIDLHHLEFTDWHGIALKVNSVRSVSDIYYNNNRSDADTVGIEVNVPDKVISKLQGKGGFTGIVIKNSNVVIEDSQLWLSDRNRINGTLDGGKFIHVKDGSGIMINNCVSDTYQYALYFDQNQIRGSLANFHVINNNVLYNNTTLYLINKYEPLLGNAIIRMTNFASTSTNFTIGSPCLLDIQVFDGTPTDPVRLQNSDTIKPLLQNYDGTSISSSAVTFNTASSIYMKEGVLELHIDLSFNTPSLQKFYINTSGMSGMSMIRGYEYVHDIASDDSLGYATVERASNNKILITHRTSGYIKRVAFNVQFRMY